MKFYKLLNAIFASALLLSCFQPNRADVNGGTECAGCVLIVGLIEQLAQVHETDIATAAEKLCNSLPPKLQTACDVLFQAFGPEIINAIYEDETPDLACHSLGFCTQDPGTDFCHLFPLPSSKPVRVTPKTPVYKRSSDKASSICNLPGISIICDHINKFKSDHLPVQDGDGDKFSSLVEAMRGTMWRGKDCDDSRKEHYPGRKPLNDDKEEDSNCNGIHGIDPQTLHTYEELYCNRSEARGVIVLGDSAAAHFHIPPEYFMADTLNENTFKDAMMIIENEWDWPMLSSSTAFTSDEWPDSITGPNNSIFKYLVNRNLCNHRDYQNIGVNGAASDNMNTYVKTMARIPTDKPALVLLSLIGNDVCNGHPDTISHMTTTSEYRLNMMNILKYLDTQLPNGSYVIISGLADGRVLWELLHDRYHPIGQLNQDVKYPDLYSFLNCLQVSPCTGWMVNNATLRDLTSERAANLSAVGKNIAKTEQFNSFKTFYMDFDIRYVISQWEKMGGEGWQVLEPVDGFHPNQISQSLTADYIWHNLTIEHPYVLGPENHFNKDIRDIFGDQGRY